MRQSYEVVLRDGTTTVAYEVAGVSTTPTSVILLSRRGKTIFTFDPSQLVVLRKLHKTELNGRKKRTVLPQTTKDEIVALRGSGLLIREVAVKYGVSQTFVWNMWNKAAE